MLNFGLFSQLFRFLLCLPNEDVLKSEEIKHGKSTLKPISSLQRTGRFKYETLAVY